MDLGGRRRFKASAENIDPRTGNVTSRVNNILSTATEDGENVNTRFVGQAGYMRWNIEFLDGIKLKSKIAPFKFLADQQRKSI